MLVAPSQESQAQPQQPRRAEDRKAFDYIAVSGVFEVPSSAAGEVNLVGREMALDRQE
jgi:hypothetical protein